jgi:hypothetical protein
MGSDEGAPSWSQHSSGSPQEGGRELGLPLPLAPNLELSPPQEPSKGILSTSWPPGGWKGLSAEPQFKCGDNCSSPSPVPLALE